MGEVTGWQKLLTKASKDYAIKNLSDDGRVFFETFRSELAREVRKLTNAMPGDRGGVVRPFTTAIKAVLQQRGIVPDASTATVDTPVCQKRADLSFTYRKKQWIFEIKTGLDFNSLGAAALGALAFLKQRPTPRYVVISLYDRFNTASKPAYEAHRTLRNYGFPFADELDIYVVSRPYLGRPDLDVWCAEFANGIETLVYGLPGAYKSATSRLG